MEDEMKTIADGDRVRRFVEDEAVRAALVRLEKSYVDEMITGTTVELREKAHAKVTAVRDLATELKAIVDRGKFTAVQRERREQREATEAAQRSRQGNRARR